MSYISERPIRSGPPPPFGSIQPIARFSLTGFDGLALATLLLLGTACAPTPPGSSAANDSRQPARSFDSSAWQRVLDAYARDGGLDYAGLAADRGDLDSYLESIESASPEEWDAAEQLAFWSNAYNAVVAEFVLEEYPEIESVKDVAGFFDRSSRTVAGEPMTLDQIEGSGRELGDPRIHFAVVCASTSCPDLPADAFDSGRLDEQLAALTTSFLANPEKGLRYDSEANVLWLSSIFKWYAGDFTGGSTVVAYFARSKVADWVAARLPDELSRTILEREPAIRYLDYDWSLNDR